ncbi:hypothetical protein CJ030_MR8G020263 [Morella rubra]|uniref:Uncharacterized protein n=1 Tax=Morella rubra TaxID=262757 RepID=A0A6A1UQX0_9ROSI|nr:hypothetical protein CJ030_MR8G020263 [Morella rubra]
MVKRKQLAGRSSKPTKVPRKSKPRPFDASRFVDARASELFHSTFHNRKVIIEREVLLIELPVATVYSYFSSRHWDPFLQDLTHLVPPELLVREFYSNFFDVDEASLSFSVFICGQRLRVSPDVIASLFGVVRVPEPVYPYVESSREPPSFEAMSLLLFGHPYPYAVRLYRAHSIAFPPDGPFPDTLSAIGATILSLSRAHLKRRQATTSASVPPDDPSSSVPPSILFSSAGPSHSTLPTPLDPSIATSFSLIMDQLAVLTTQSVNLIQIVMRHQRQLKHHTLTLARHARATELNTRAVSRLHRLIRPLVGADALLSDISSSSESSASTGASAPSFEVPAADSFPVADPPLPSSTPAADSPPVANPTPPSSTPVADPPASSAPMSPTGTVVLSSHSSPATVVLSSPSSSAAVDSATFDASTPPLDD